MEMTRTHRTFIHYYRQKYPESPLSDFNVLFSGILSGLYQEVIRAMSAIKAIEGNSIHYSMYASIHGEMRILFNNARLRSKFSEDIYNYLVLQEMSDML